MRTKIAKAKPEEMQELLQQDPIVPRLALLMNETNSWNRWASSTRCSAATARRSSKQVRYYGEYKLGRSQRSASTSTSSPKSRTRRCSTTTASTPPTMPCRPRPASKS